MSDDERQIAWRALERGTPVFTKDGEQLGKITHVVADDSKDIFSGVAFSRGMLGHDMFAPATTVETITTEGVHLTLSHQEVENELEPFSR